MKFRQDILMKDKNQLKMPNKKLSKLTNIFKFKYKISIKMSEKKFNKCNFRIKNLCKMLMRRIKN